MTEEEELFVHSSNAQKSLLENVDFYIFAFEIKDFARNFSQEIEKFRKDYKINPNIPNESFFFTVGSFFSRTFTYHVYLYEGQEYLGELHSSSSPFISEETLTLLADKSAFSKDKRRLVIKKNREEILPRELQSYFDIFIHPLPKESYIETDEFTQFDIYQINPALYVLERF